MTLNFFNVSRSYDPSKRLVSFWGHDATMEIAFQVDESALQKLSPNTDYTEASLLRAFDANRARIEQAASVLYARKRQSYCRLSASNF